MQYFDIPPLQVALEEMDELITELSQEPLVDADDVSEDLNNELNSLNVIRDDIVENGINQNKAVQISAAIEGFSLRNPLREFTFNLSIEGLIGALEEIDDKRQNVLQRIWSWFLTKLQNFKKWLANLFTKGGKAQESLDKAKAMAQDVKDNRNPAKFEETVNKPKAAAQEARIEPEGEKSGSFEDFSDRLEKYVEPLKPEWTRILNKIRGNPILSTVCVNPESVSTFFTHMEQVQDKTAQIRQILDKIGSSLRSGGNVEELTNTINSGRTQIYQLFGGADASVLESIRQQQFNEQSASQFEDIDYDKLVPIMVKVTNSIPAANAEQRINDLNYLTKALENFQNIANTNVLKRVDASQRNVLISAMQGLGQDITKFVSTFIQDWSLVLKLYTSVSQFFSDEKAYYYKTIAAIQKAATEVFEEGDRNAVLDNFKQMGFAVDLTPEELSKRGVGTESLEEAFLGLEAALEGLECIDPGEPPVYGTVFQSGLMAALEEEQATTDAPSFYAKIKQWFARFLEWIKSFFVKKVQYNEKKIEIIKEKKEEKTQEEEAFAESQGTTPEKASKGDKIRPEIMALFNKCFNDQNWYNKASSAEPIKKFLNSQVANMFVLCTGKDAPQLKSLVNDIFTNNTKFWLFFKTLNHISGLRAAADNNRLALLNTNFSQLETMLKNARPQARSLADVGDMIRVANKDYFLTSMRWTGLAQMVKESVEKVWTLMGDLDGKSEHPADIQEAAQKIQKITNSLMVLSNMVEKTYEFVCVPQYLHKEAIISEMFENESNKPSEAEIKLLSMSDSWNA